MAKLAVIHLVRAANGLAVLQEFVTSYRLFPAGAEHELVLLCKGFTDERALVGHRDLLQGIPHRTLLVADRGLDIGSYREALQHCDHDLLCFLNSFSRILAADWLAKLAAPAQLPEVGLSGATGSWESLLTSLRALAGDRERGLLRRSVSLVRARREARNYQPFPNPHVRTNAFLARRELLLSLRWPTVRSKANALAFESGVDGLTAQVRRRGLQVLIVGRDGVAQGQEHWPTSRTFRTGNQDNLLVADNQTAAWQRAPAAERQWLARQSWGAADTCQDAGA